MDFLNKSFSHVTDLFRSMTPAARITTALLLAVVVVSVVFLFQHGGESADEYLFGAEPLTSRDIETMAAALSAAGLNDWDDKGNRIRVPRGQRPAYITAIAEANALPQSAGSAWEDMFQDASPFESRQMREFRALRALEQDMAYTIRSLDGVQAATVNIGEAASERFGAKPVRRVSVMVRAADNRGLSDAKLKVIRDIVSMGASTDEVMVADANGEHSYTADGNSTIDNQHARAKRLYENDYVEKISRRLKHIPGVNVEAHVVVSDKAGARTHTVKLPPQGSPRFTTFEEEEEKRNTYPPGGRPGTAANVQGNTPRVAGGTTESTVTTSSERTENVFGVTETNEVTAGFTPEQVTASIGVPMSYYETLWLKENPAPAGQPAPTPTRSDLTTIQDRVNAQIEAAVVKLLPPPPPGDNPFPSVEVTPYVDLVRPTPDPPGIFSTLLTWLSGNWQSLGMFGVAIIGVFVLRGMVQATVTPLAGSPAPVTSPAATFSAAAAHSADDEDDDEVIDAGNSLRARFQSSGRSLRDELAEVVREDPDAAAAVLKNWVSDAA